MASIALYGGYGSISEARHFAVDFLDRVRDGFRVAVSDRARDLTQLVVSELVTNAAKYAAGPVLLELHLLAHAVDIVVWDSDPTVPEARDADPNRIGQHGLEIVQAVAENLSIRTEPVGKRITARMPLTDSC
ncbi:ATP-binding protein [Streptomyces sp. J2-1]|uniref:ATP-binding protein n=1 Tax=Streptomyces corallincola TaxID=2851888 RepID=UPI001C3810AF|nr:ATP-binding protein [Streptomyces corallincola]MBV2356729.1 ATP-binding protein [Streptomyces corallincola]